MTFMTYTCNSGHKRYVHQGCIKSIIETVLPVHSYSGTVHNTRVSARKDGPRARIAYSIHLHATDSHRGAARWLMIVEF